MRAWVMLLAMGLIAGCAQNNGDANVSQTNMVENLVENTTMPLTVPANVSEPVANQTASATPLPTDLTDSIKSGGADLSVICAAYLAHRLDSASAAEKPAVEQGRKAWRAKLDREMTKDEAAQYFASTWAVLRDATSDGLRAAAGYCLENMPGAS